MQEINLLMNQVRLKEYNYRACVHGLLYSLLMEIIKINQQDVPVIIENGIHNRRKQTRLRNVLDYMEEHYAENLKIADIARNTFISEGYLRRLFMNYYQLTPQQYLNRIRIEKACQLLQESDDGVLEIGYKVGYESTSAYLRNFSKIVGMTPKQWRDQKRKSEP